MAKKAMLIDTSICMACKGCQAACKEWNDLPAESTRNFGSYQNPPKLTAKTWMTVKFIEFSEDGGLQWLFQPMHCMHCTEAPCVWVCPTGAMHQVQDNYVVVNTEWCIGCRYCVQACPFDVAQFEPQLGVVRKCTFCIDRVVNGLSPACVKTCPAGAIQFGDRDALIARAKSRVGELQQLGHTRANLYGETQLGGLNTLYILLQPPATYGLPEQPKFPSRTLVLNWLSSAIAAVLLPTFPLWWVIRRRMDAQEATAPVEGGKRE